MVHHNLDPVVAGGLMITLAFASGTAGAEDAGGKTPASAGKGEASELGV